MSDHPDGKPRPRIARNLGALQSRTFDLAIVGGGITGAGIARQAAANGLSVVLLEAKDYASGSSSKSTRLIHGGLRYSTLGNIKLALEVAREGKNIHRLAPHLAQPMTMVTPLRNRWQWLKLKLGLTVYELLGGLGRGDPHAHWNAGKLTAEEPSLRASDFPYSWAHREYLTDDARLVLALVRAAISDGAEAANYVRVDAVKRHRDQCFLYSRDMLSGTELTIRARCVANAAGPWAEQILQGQRSAGQEPSADSEVGDEQASTDDSVPDNGSSDAVVELIGAESVPSRLCLSRGVHIAVPRERLPIHNMIYLDTADRRGIFAIPRGQVTCIGTTDTAHEPGEVRWPEVTEADIEYLLAPLGNYFSGLKLTSKDVVSTWAGLRSVINQPGKTAEEISDKDQIWLDERGIITIAGGKSAGFRRMSVEVLTHVGVRLNRNFSDEDSLMALPGGNFSEQGNSSKNVVPVTLDSEISRIGARYKLDNASAGRLVRLYGSEVEAVLGESPTFISNSVYTEEVDWAIAIDGAISLEDVLYRRLRCVWFEPMELTELLPAVTECMAKQLGWDSVEQHRQRVATEKRIALDLAAVPS